ncbi:EPB41L2 family protein [Megaselia abdita]
MPGETKEVPSAGTETLTPTKTKHQTSSSKAALARVTLLDGSILDVTIDRKAKGRDLISSICAGLNIQEKEYFGLIYTTAVDPRVWLDLDKPVSKFFKTDPWVLQFAVKFYPPEPAQLKEDITRYQLCLQVRNDILEGRLPCSFVTHALLGSYLVQSEMGDYDPKEMPDRSYLKDFKIAPNQAPDLEDKVMDLHKSHRGQSPAEAELHYLENAKKLALYGVDLHPAKDSEGVDIMLGVCSAGIFVHRDKLRINRFAWPKILKISYKRHHFYVKIRPGEFEQYESTIGFKLANHRAAKKLWKSCVEHHTFFRLMTPEQPNKAGLFPRFGSKYRYTGPTMAESRNNTLNRDQPRFDRTLSGRGLPSKSMDGIVQAEKERKKYDPKRQSLPPDSIADPVRSRSPLKNDKKEKLKRESSVGTASASSQSSIEGDYEPPTDPIIDDEKESPEKDKKSQKGVNGTEENGDKTPSRGRGGIFGSGRKSPKKDKSKDKEPVAVAVSEGSPSPDKGKGYTRPYEYSESELDVSPTRRSYNIGGFSYDKPNDGNRGSVTNGNDGQMSPNSRNKKTALAFNYAPEDEKLKEHADKILYGQLSPKTKDKLAKGQLSPKTREKLLKEANLSPKTRRLLSGDGLPPKDGKSYSPSSPSAEFASGAAGKYTPIDGIGTKVVPGVALGGGKPKKKHVKIMLIVSKFDPKTKAIDTENGHVEHLTGLMDTETGVIDTKFGKIDPKKCTLESYNPDTNKVELFKGDIDGKTGNLHFTTGGVVDPRTGKVDNTLGEVVSIVPEENPVVELTCITSKIDPKTKKVDTVNGDLEYSPAVLDIENQVLHTKYGQIHLKTGELKVVDPKTGKLISSSKNVTLDPKTQQITINGVVDPKSGKLDPTQGRLIEVGQQIDPLVEVTTISGKLDSKKNVIDPKTADFEKSTGQYNPKTGKIDTKYGQLDLIRQTLTSVDPKTGKTVVKDVKIDPVSGQVVLKNQINPKTGKQDKDYGRIMSLKIITTRFDPVTKKPILSPEDAIIDPVTNQIWTPTGAVDPITKEKQYVSSTVDPKTGTIITIYGYLNPKTNEIRKQTKIDGNLVKVDPGTGRIFTATGDTDANGEPLFATTEFDPTTGDVYTKVGKVDPKTKKIVLVKILLLSKPDPKTGLPQEIDPDTCDIDPTTGRVTKFFNKTVYVYNMVDPITGDIIQVDPNDPRFAGAKTTVTQTMTLSGEVDPVTGRIKTEWGHIDPKTGDIDPKTAVKDPVTGQLILNYAQIDPSHFGKDKIRRSSYASSDDDDMAEYSLDQPKKQTAPTVVQTTTKQTITKTNDGVTHNVQEEIRNLGTGEVTISTQEHKADASGNDTSGAYLQATAVTTRTATTHEDLGKKARTEQLEEKTVGTTRTYDPSKQEQRVVTQEVKTTVTATSGDQYTRRDSISSTSSGDSGTPIDGLDESYTATSTTYKPSEHATEEPSRVVLGQTSSGITEGEIVSSQTVSSKTRTVETITYKTERDGIVETRVEQKITIQSDGDPIDHDKALAEAIQEATAMNPDMTVEKIEIQQQTQ